ncbi:MAG: retroviral-like aspartic protease family protein [Gemmataceae bacterium]|nr:retroviral-like aspartic protease family protein [Gemmataceae bacterium]MDW8267452.1 retropepsin-like aspartic protease [Gemmataceae bacterium]
MRAVYWAVLGLGLVPTVAGGQAPPAKPVTVPFELLRSKHMVVRVKLNGKGPYRLLFDTGAPLNVIGVQAARESGLLTKTARPPAFFLAAPKPVAIPLVELGELKAEKVPAMIMDHPAVAALSQAFGPIDGILGFPFFARYRMTLDYQASEMTFVPNGYEPPDVLEALMAALLAPEPKGPRVVAAAGLWGFTVEKPDGDTQPGVVVKEVYAGGAAAAGGLKPGDRLLTLGGHWTDSVADCHYAASALPPGQAHPVIVRRQQQEIRLSLTPRPGL